MTMKLSVVPPKEEKPQKPPITLEASEGGWFFRAQLTYSPPTTYTSGGYRTWGFSYYKGDPSNANNYVGSDSFRAIEDIPWIPEFKALALTFKALINEWEEAVREEKPLREETV